MKLWHIRMVIGVLCLTAAAAISAAAYWQHHTQQPSSETVVGSMCEGIPGTGTYCGYRWWVIVKSHDGVQRTVPVTKTVYDGCHVGDTFNPADVPACTPTGKPPIQADPDGQDFDQFINDVLIPTLHGLTGKAGIGGTS